MSDETKILIELIKQNKSLNEISQILGLSNKQIFMRLSMLRNSGYLIDKNYYYNGDIRYQLHDPFKSTADIISVITEKDCDTIRIMLTSYTHLGHNDDEIRYIDSMMEYCINNDIHLIFNLGDFFEGFYESRRNYVKFNTPEEQITYALQNYPYDKNILNFILLGNHDTTFWTEFGIDIKTVLENRRHDLVPVDYGYGEINVGGCLFRMQHTLSDEYNKEIPKNHDNRIILKGHSHRYKTNHNGNSLNINVPSLSNLNINPSIMNVPGIIDMQLNINNTTICRQQLKHFIFINNQMVQVDEVVYNIPIKVKQLNENAISLPNKYADMSQTDI